MSIFLHLIKASKQIILKFIKECVFPCLESVKHPLPADLQAIIKGGQNTYEHTHILVVFWNTHFVSLS